MLRLWVKNDYLTDCVNFDFAEVHLVIFQRKLYDDVSEVKPLFTDVCTLYADCASIGHGSRVLTTEHVVP